MGGRVSAATWAEGRQLSLLPDPLESRFLAFHHANPNVYRELVAMARQWHAAGHTQAGIAMFFEVLRWQSGLRGDGDAFALNNSYRSRYARLIAANEPDLAGMFTLRTLGSE